MIPDEPSLSGEPTPGRDKGRSRTLAEYSLEELIARWEEFFSELGLESEIIGLADRYPEGRSLKIRFEDLNRFDTDMSIHLLRQPLNVLTAGEEAIRRVVPPTEEPVEIHLRVQGVPRDSRVQIRDLRAKHLGRFIAVEGLVRKATEVRPMVVDALFQCLRCGTVIKEPQEGQAFREPMECYEDQGGCKRTANATKFKLLGEASRFTDTQKIEVQEAPEGLRGGEEPQRLSAFTEDDLTGKINPGMRVILNGILRSSQKGRPGQKSTLFDILLDVNSTEFEQVEFEEIEVTPEDIKKIEAEAADPDIYRKIVASIAPSLYGLTTEKEALALQLFSGVAKEMPDGRRIRGDIHILLVGDPGTGKSELLSYMSRLSPRGIYATGKAASAAGLTAAAVRDEFGEGRWTLEAGALVLADKGLAAIDELEKMNPQDRSAIHEAMEQQRISVAKAGITAVLQARCAVLAAANPKFGRFDETKFVAEQLDLAPTLLSRFDVIFSLIDHPESERDRNMAEHILRGHLVGEWRRRRAEGKEVPDENVEYIEAYSPHFEPIFFRKYVAYAKRFSPVMTPESMETIKAKYLEIRKAGEPAGASVPITPRQLEAIIRLAEASARARLSQRVDPEDAERAVRITEYWMRRVAGEEGRFDIDIVQTGISQSQRDQIITLRDVINQLSEQGPSGSADYEDIVRVAGERGIPQVKVDQWLKRWAQEGDVYTPGKNKYKLVERL
ncbi:MAG: minichromosome maintenance protein MCM [Methanobacteriota archaeon]|nr:MAG: minichromosome maintenance protein MCM [Euryarchaeota archaeon]